MTYDPLVGDRDWYVVDVGTNVIVDVIHTPDGKRPTNVLAVAVGGGLLRLDDCPAPEQLEDLRRWSVRT